MGDVKMILLRRIVAFLREEYLSTQDGTVCQFQPWGMPFETAWADVFPR